MLVTAFRRFALLVFWVLPQEIIRFPIEIYGPRRALLALAVFAGLALLSVRLDRVTKIHGIVARIRGRWWLRVLGTLAKLALILPTLFYWIWFYAYTRVGVAVAAVCMVAVMVLRLVRARRFALLPSLMGFAWIAFAVVMGIRVPPLASHCPGEGTNPRTHVVLSRSQIDALPGLRWSNPYDVARDPVDGRIFVSHQSAFWTTELGGQLTVIARDGSATNVALPADETCTLYPDRLALDSAGRRLFALTSGNGVYCLAELDISSGLAFRRLVRLGGEAHGIVHREGRLFVLFWPAEGDALYHDVVIEVLDAGDFHSIARFSAESEQDGRKIAVGRRVGIPSFTEGGRMLWVPALEGTLLSLDLDSLAFRERKLPFWLAASAVVDPERELAYLLSPVRWQLERVDLRNGAHTPAMKFHAMPQLVLVNPVDQRWYTLSFTTGALIAWFGAGDWRSPPAAHVGRLARNAIVDPDSGHLWVASGCGVYEIEPSLGAAP